MAVTLAIGLIASYTDAGTGSNLGVYATNFSPAVVTGQVTDGGIPVSGATTTDGGTDTVEASAGTSAVLILA